MKIAVYCSAASQLPQEWIDDARTLGTWIGTHNAQLIYGGVEAGLMTVVATAAKEAGGRIVGVVPVRRLDKASPLADIKISAADLCERKSAMQMLADTFVVLPGGYGTLDELISTFAQINFTDRGLPIILCNTDGLFDPVLAQLALFVERGLMDAGCMDVLHVARSIEELTAILDGIEKNLTR